ncbi:LRR receptor-like serine/threonine-protein kinase EFR [Prosopis cineraria]|uniref:LRR receptor-like serine/threonine-protein kinase EFR n=1 Tax=Prosopis cineraria TaxID=364024 RepID=UPI00241012F8|nr:LRR receptor-like serine/threonine-protein kinase EFR [Prosopis cineraria]
MANLCFHFSFSMFLLLCLMIHPTCCHTNFSTDELALRAFRFSVRDPYNHLDDWTNSSSICNWLGVTCDYNYGTVRILDLSEMSLKGTLPSQIGNLSFLVKLDLHSNNFYGELPKELFQLRKLKILNLSYNAFNGVIPTWIGSLSALQHLILNNNSFDGVIPSSISNLSKLESLECRSNFIKGSIPFEIVRLGRLKILRISVNNLSGIIPSAVSNLSSLEHIILSYNFLSGNILETIGALTNLKIISLSVNKLSGQIPRSIGNLTLLQELYLDHNNLEGGIPEQIGNLKSLKILYLDTNQFSGHLPSTIFNLSELQVIDLSWNNLSGAIPSNICHGLPNLQALLLQANKLFGAMPYGWTQCKQLKTLELEVNFFTGRIPKSITNLTMLQQLTMHSNNLKGIILLRHKRQQNSRGLVKIDLSILGLPKRISYFEIQEATNGFDESNILGRGSYGSVFKGKLSSEMIIAVKIFKFDSHVMLRSFEKECDILRNARHRNLVKPSNILLDNEMVAHVSDFGISKLLDKEESKTNTETVPTIGYVAPEYGYFGVVSTKVDVYSYGIMLLEVFTRKRPTEDMFVEGLNLKSWDGDGVRKEEEDDDAEGCGATRRGNAAERICFQSKEGCRLREYG